MADWNKLKVPDLKAELKKRGLPQTGLKAALVARLESADTESGFESEATLQEEPAQSNSVPDEQVDSPSTIEPQSAIEVAFEPEVLAATTSGVVAVSGASETQNEIATQDFAPQPSTVPEPEAPIRCASEQSEPPSMDAHLSSLPSVEPQDAAEDRLKRKRRSKSPPPSATDTPRKRARPDKDLPFTDVDIPAINDLAAPKNQYVDGSNTQATAHSGAIETLKTEDSAQPISTIVDPTEEIRVEPVQVDQKMTEGVESADNETAPDTLSSPKPKDSRFKGLFTQSKQESSLDRVDIQDAALTEPDRMVKPAIHAATCALYIRDFMRPLNPTALKDHLSTLAAAPGSLPDPTVIVDFFLDPIRTHALISFSNTSAASRVRSELHGQIWPNERTRKPLWADFIPPENVQQWADEEQAASGGSRSGAKKWEVVYAPDDNGSMTARLQEAGAPSLSVRRPSAPIAARRPSVSRPGIEGAPLGPRAEQVANQRAIAARSNLDELFKSTVATPVLYYQPVSQEVANKRLDSIEYATAKGSRRGGGTEINRYTFEGVDVLVDRGPEIFSGIRPPPGYRGRGGGGHHRGRGDRYDRPDRYDRYEGGANRGRNDNRNRRY
jgi:hypothetical protein